VKEPASSGNAAAWSCWANYPPGLAHELNNFGPAAKLADDQTRYTLATMRSANFELRRQPLDDSDKARIEQVEASLLQSGATQLDGLALTAR